MKYTIPVNVRLDETTDKKLYRLAKSMRRDKSEAIRILIQDADITAYERCAKTTVTPGGCNAHTIKPSTKH